MYTLGRDWFTKVHLWDSLIGLPHHLWSSANVVIGKAALEELLVVDKACLEF